MPALNLYAPADNCNDNNALFPRPGPSSFDATSEPSERYNHNIGSPLPANVFATNDCGDRKVNTKSRRDDDANNVSPTTNEELTNDTPATVVVGATVAEVRDDLKDRARSTVERPPGET